MLTVLPEIKAESVGAWMHDQPQEEWDAFTEGRAALRTRDGRLWLVLLSRSMGVVKFVKPRLRSLPEAIVQQGIVDAIADLSVAVDVHHIHCGACSNQDGDYRLAAMFLDLETFEKPRLFFCYDCEKFVNVRAGARLLAG